MGRVMSWGEAEEQCQAWREQGRRIVFTNGHFELLHVGHVDYLQRARDLGDVLLVGVNGDTSTEELKGPQRPIVSAGDRARVLSSLACVDGVIIFDELTAELLISLLRPDIYVKGGDWSPDAGRQPPEALVVQSYGGQVSFLPYLPSYSTSQIIQTILKRYGRRT